MISKRIAFPSIFWLLLISIGLFAQKQQPWSSGEILHQMKKLNVLGSVLYMAAHPDDENTRLIAYMARERQYRTGYMAMTRGDGGQNLIGNEQGFELGLIRTQELLGARRVDGGEQFFSRAFDFGYSKRTEEALQFWDKEKIIADAVWVIRNFKPDIIISRFPEDSRAGHGHHSGSAVVAREAFIAAGDPNRYPEQLKNGVKPWKAKRIMWNTFSFGGSNTTSESQMKIEVGGFLPLIGKSIGEISAESRSQHRSQGFGSASSRGSATEYFLHTSGDRAEKDPMDGVDCSWNRVEGGKAIEGMVNALVSSYSIQDPAASIPQLLAIKKALSGVKDDYWRERKMGEVDKLIQMAAGLHLEALSDKQHVRQGDTLKLSLNMINRSAVAVAVSSVKLNDLQLNKSDALKRNINWNQSISLPISPNHPVSQPYWLVNEMNKGYFNVTDQQLIGKGQNDPAFEVKVTVNISSEPVTYSIPVMHRIVDPAIGEFFHPVMVVPPVTVSSQPKAVLKKTPGKNTSRQLSMGNNAPPVMTKIDYEHIPSISYFTENKQLEIDVDLKTAGKKIGYIVGAGDKVTGMIELMGFEVTELGRADITPEKLKQFDAVVVGVRAYNVNDWMGEKYDMLMDYVRSGGNMVVQYNTNSFAGPLQRLKIGPKPFLISRGRVSEEDAEVKFLEPNDPVLNFPNKISQDDFKGWIQERGIYYADSFSDDYKAIFGMNDIGESELKGSLIVRNEGKGRFMYTGLVFFRQLPAGVPGAIRLFANMISNPNAKVNESK